MNFFKMSPNDNKRPPQLWEYLFLGVGGCFVASIFLFKQMFGSWVSPESEGAYAFYTFLSLVPGVIIGLIWYNAKKADYENEQRKIRAGQPIYTHLQLKPSEPETSSPSTKQCPYCGETILAVAKKCKHCHEFLEVAPAVKMIQCPVCGEDIPDDTEICPFCNEPVIQKNI